MSEHRYTLEERVEAIERTLDEVVGEHRRLIPGGFRVCACPLCTAWGVWAFRHAVTPQPADR